MGISWYNLNVRGLDVSEYDKTIDWNKMKSVGNPDFVIMRAGYGKTTDKQFLANWANSHGKTFRLAYWFMDYYSAETSGTAQADYLWNLIKNDYDLPIVVLDIESGGSSYSPPIYEVWDKAQQIARDFLSRMYYHTKRKSAIYTSLSVTELFSNDLKAYPLWVAWYDEMIGSETSKDPTLIRSTSSVISACRENGWTGDVLFWQYASNGDLDDDNIGDGTKIGLGRDVADLNNWLGTKDQFLQFKASGSYKPEEVKVPFKVKVILNGTLNIRSGAGTNYSVVGGAKYGEIYTVYEVSGDWMRIGTNRWFYGIPSYVEKLSDTPPTEPTDSEKLKKLWDAHPEIH